MKRTLIFTLLSCLLLFLLIGCSSQDYIDKIESYSQGRTELTFGEALNFEWDIAYNDQKPYQKAEDIKEISGYNFQVDRIGTDQLYRFLFFNEGKLVTEIRYEFGIFEFYNEVIEFYPDTVFSIEWYNYIGRDGNTYPHLRLTSKE